MKKGMKKIICVLAVAIGLSFVPNSSQACDGNYFMCISWMEQINDDITNNCGGVWEGNITWIKCDN